MTESELESVYGGAIVLVAIFGALFGITLIYYIFVQWVKYRPRRAAIALLLIFIFMVSASVTGHEMILNGSTDVIFQGFAILFGLISIFLYIVFGLSTLISYIRNKQEYKFRKLGYKLYADKVVGENFLFYLFGWLFVFGCVLAFSMPQPYSLYGMALIYIFVIPFIVFGFVFRKTIFGYNAKAYAEKMMKNLGG